jgi:hypothetical protein
MMELHLHSPICLHGIVLNILSTGKILYLTDILKIKSIKLINFLIYYANFTKNTSPTGLPIIYGRGAAW